MRSVVITGVSQGLGAALFDEFHSAGDRVLALGRRFTQAQHEAQRAEPDRIRLRQVDLAEAASLPALDEFAAVLSGARHAVLVHNAAVIEPVGAIGTLDPAEVAKAVTVNLVAPMLLTNTLLAADLAGPGAGRITIVFVSSGAAHRVSGGRSVYSTTKRAGETFFEALAAQCADPGAPADGNAGANAAAGANTNTKASAGGRIRAVVVDPGIMDTGMQATLRRYARSGAYFPGRERFLSLYEQGRLPSPAEVARKIIAEHLR